MCHLQTHLSWLNCLTVDMLMVLSLVAIEELVSLAPHMTRSSDFIVLSVDLEFGSVPTLGSDKYPDFCLSHKCIVWLQKTWSTIAEIIFVYSTFGVHLHTLYKCAQNLW